MNMLKAVQSLNPRRSEKEKKNMGLRCTQLCLPVYLGTPQRINLCGGSGYFKIL